MRIVLTNVPPDRSEDLARTLVGERLVACVNFYPVRSIYRWQGEVQVDEEVTLMMKVPADGVERLKARLLALHPHELPEFVVLAVDAEASLREYVGFVRDACAAG
jgi:periplasmic divalent cation tolerance protein